MLYAAATENWDMNAAKTNPPGCAGAVPPAWPTRIATEMIA
jgi:hypothetical protein